MFSLRLEQLTTKVLKQNSNSHKGVELCAETEKHKTISGISDAIFPARHPQKSSQHVRECAAGTEKLYHIMGPTLILEMARARTVSVPDYGSCLQFKCQKSNLSVLGMKQVPNSL